MHELFSASTQVVADLLACAHSGLDNAGKTTIVKKFNGEDIDTISPTVRIAWPFRCRDMFCTCS
jgi:hypothetical protein